MLTAIIVAAGSSQRMGFDKLFALLGDKPVIAHTLDAFERAECVDEIILVGRDDRLAELQELVRRAELKKVRHVVSGGVHRQDSVRAGLNLLAPDARYVAVHDAARPLITSEQIGRVFADCRVHGAAALAEPITDTLKRADENSFCLRWRGSRRALCHANSANLFPRSPRRSLRCRGCKKTFDHGRSFGGRTVGREGASRAERRVQPQDHLPARFIARSIFP